MSPKCKLSSVGSSGTRHTDRNMPVTNMEKPEQRASSLLTFLNTLALEPGAQPVPARAESSHGLFWLQTALCAHTETSHMWCVESAF